MHYPTTERGGPYSLADLDPLAQVDRGVQISCDTDHKKLLCEKMAASKTKSS